MTHPKRIQRKRSKGWRMPDNTVYVGRPTKWGNPFVVGQNGIKTAKRAADMFATLCELNQDFIAVARDDLRGKNLACWCPIGSPCHADILLKLANEVQDD